MLYPHQKKSLELTSNKNKCAYYLDMGLGKTFVGAEKMHLLNNNLNLIVCQKSKIDDWIEHIKTYYPHYQVFDLTKKKQAGEFQGLHNNQVVAVINYDLVFRRPYLAEIDGFTLLLDESSLICNEKAKRSKFVLRMHPDNVILLSGTPTAGKYERLWSQLKLLGWKISKKAYYSSYVITKWVEYGGFQHEVVIGYKNVEHLKKKLSEFGAIFMKTEEVMELPEQVEQKIYVKPSAEYKKFMKNDYIKIYDKELIGDNSLTKMLYGRQLCGHYHKEKLQAFEDLISSTNDRVIVFYNFMAELEALQQIALRYTDKISILNGKQKDLQAYNQYTDSITFVQYQAGAMGVNLQLANKIIYFTLPLGKGSCDLWEQSKKRIHRIGQKKTCFYYYLLVKGSIEEKNLKALKEGKELTDELFKENKKD